jgi:ketosteroid isomerase-like protein
MRVRSLALPVLALGALLAACSRTPRVDLTAEREAIRDADRRWVGAETAKNIDAIVAFYAADAVEMADNTPLIRGRDAIRQWYETWLTPAGVSMTFASDTVVVAASGDLAYDVGTYHFRTVGRTGNVDDVGKYLTVWKKVDGEWKVAVDMGNSDLPLPSP